MALNFPSSPSVGQVFTDSTSGNTYRWTGTYWKSYSTVNPATDFDVVNLNVSGVTSTRHLRVTGFSTIGNATVGVVTATEVDTAGVTTSLHLQIVGVSTLASLYASGISTFNSNVAVAGVTTSQHLRVTGVTTVVSLNATGIATIGSSVTISSSGINASSGIITAQSFVGSGSSLTGLPAGFNELDGMLFM